MDTCCQTSAGLVRAYINGDRVRIKKPGEITVGDEIVTETNIDGSLNAVLKPGHTMVEGIVFLDSCEELELPTCSVDFTLEFVTLGKKHTFTNAILAGRQKINPESGEITGKTINCENHDHAVSSI